MIERIKLLIQTQNLTASQFADKINIQRSGLSHILSGRNKASLDFVQKVLTTFPDVSPDWLINGKGSMFRNLREREQDNPQEDSYKMPFKGSLFDVEETTAQAEKEEQSGNAEKVKSSNSEKAQQDAYADQKKTERIIILYTDGTFKDYFPA